MKIEDITNLIKSRRSHFTKEFNGAIAPKSLIDNLVNNANWAPSHKLTMPWHFVVFEGKSMQALTNKILEIQTEKNPEMDEAKISKIKNIPQKVSHILAICLKPSFKVPLWEEYCSIGAAVQNIYLTLNTQNDFGGYWTTGNATNSQEMKEYLGLEETHEHLGFFFVGGLDQKRTLAHRNAVSVEWK